MEILEKLWNELRDIFPRLVGCFKKEINSCMTYMNTHLKMEAYKDHYHYRTWL